MCRPSGGKSLSLLDYWILKFNSMERAKGSKWPTAVGPEPDTSSEKEKNARMSPERTKRTKKKLGRSSVRLGLWQARQPAAFLCSCLGLLWGLSTFFVTSLEDNHQRRGRKLYFLESNEKEVERSKQTNPGTDLENIWNSLEITLELKYRVQNLLDHPVFSILLKVTEVTT